MELMNVCYWCTLWHKQHQHVCSSTFFQAGIDCSKLASVGNDKQPLLHRVMYGGAQLARPSMWAHRGLNLSLLKLRLKQKQQQQASLALYMVYTCQPAAHHLVTWAK
jgi:hypothetical protein